MDPSNNDSQFLTVRCFAYASNGKHPGLKRLRETAAKFNVPLETVGERNRHSGTTFRWHQKVVDFRDVLRRKVRGDQLVLLCDGYDVRFLAPPNEIARGYLELAPDRNKIVVCGERKYEHHHQRLLDSKWPASAEGPYRYPSTCMIMGPRKMLIQMLEDVERGMPAAKADKDHCRCGPRPFMPCDQSIVGLWLARHAKDYIIDHTGSLFWSTRGEDKNFMTDHAKVVRADDGTRRLKNLNTGRLPCVLHVPVPVRLSSRARRRR